MTFYLILKNWKYVKRQVGTQNKQNWIVQSKNIIINKFMTYFYAEKFCFINFPMIPIHFFRPRPTFRTVYPPPHILWRNWVISIAGASTRLEVQQFRKVTHAHYRRFHASAFWRLCLQKSVAWRLKCDNCCQISPNFVQQMDSLC